MGGTIILLILHINDEGFGQLSGLSKVTLLQSIESKV